MNEEIIDRLCIDCLEEQPKSVLRCAVGQGNFVYIVELSDRKVVIRCSEEPDAYIDTIYWLEQLEAIDIPVPRILGKGRLSGYEYVILTYFEGQDIGNVYTELTSDEKREIAKTVVDIQEKVALLRLEDIPAEWTWKAAFVDDMLARAKERIVANGYFDQEKVERLMKAAEELDGYFAGIQPLAYLDDSSKLTWQEGALTYGLGC